MIDQAGLFDVAEGQRRKDAGQIKVITRPERGAYIEAAERYIRTHPDLEPFLMEDFYEWIGPPPVPALMGALTTRLRRLGLIEPTGVRRPMRRPQSHARVTDEYRVTGGLS